MGCNAHNHPPGCDCGWGGNGNPDNLIHGRIGEKSHWALYKSHWALYTSYTQPNAQCPVCGESVYFYQSPYGGRVFFDELGIPWPKHPCTDNSTREFTTYKIEQLTWKKEGWRPFWIIDYYRTEYEEKIIRGILLDEEKNKQLELEIKNESNHKWFIDWVTSPTFIRKKSSNKYSIESYDIITTITKQNGDIEEISISAIINFSHQ